MAYRYVPSSLSLGNLLSSVIPLVDAAEVLDSSCTLLSLAAYVLFDNLT
jgi:hypothetical protein